MSLYLLLLKKKIANQLVIYLLCTLGESLEPEFIRKIGETMPNLKHLNLINCHLMPFALTPLNIPASVTKLNLCCCFSYDWWERSFFFREMFSILNSYTNTNAVQIHGTINQMLYEYLVFEYRGALPLHIMVVERNGR